MATIDLNGIRLRNRLLTSASLLGYGTSKSRLILYGLSPIAQWVPLERFGAVTTRTVSLQPREGHFTLKEDWGLREFPEMLRLYGRALHKVDAGWLNAFGWSNIGIERYFDEYFGRTANLNRIVSVGGFSADEIEQLIETVNERAKPGEIAAVELNASCHNVNFPFGTILEEALRRAVPKSRHPVILKVSPDEDYHWQANLARRTAARRSPRSTPSRDCASAPTPASRTSRTATGRSPAGRSSPSACGSWPNCATQGSASRSSPTAASATSTTAASTSGRAPMPCPWGPRSGSGRCRCTRWGRSKGCGSGG